ncbi:Pyrrolidone-carboxylate peptidase [Pirellulimonas nuda]|uniref:Pyrrolidone-carboxylate peptidase n=1 Tax=Pirellulimonas nuda TaxID=2528009 RepID=A0A518DEH0_9BACT|nr:pyroglutamyl-peptidase I [Pirellulimonas nuda]QDU89874.1 Pyrrolidone-carboxylate peptidase [Pirellulimonas nuda]
MPRVLLTAFGPYDVWQDNASWLVLEQLTRTYSGDARLTTRRYPVDYDTLRDRLASDLKTRFDAVLCLGQSPGSAVVQLERFAINVAGAGPQTNGQCRPLVTDGPAAYRSGLPLEKWRGALTERGVPCEVSHHAGDYLCNAAMYYAHYWNEQNGHDCQAVLAHLPLTPQQVIASGRALPSLPLAVSVAAVELMIASVGQPALA